MGFLNKLFGNKNNKQTTDSSIEEYLRKDYNVMKNIKIEKLDKYGNSNLYELVTDGIYKDLKDEDDACYRMTISYELEDDHSNNQYPLEDILDKYSLYVSDFIDLEKKSETDAHKLELAGDLKDLKNTQEIVGKRIFNSDFIGTDGKVRVKLLIK